MLTGIPNSPGIYALYSGESRRYVAYVGIAGNLKNRIGQHLVRRDSSVTTGTGAVRLDPDHVREVAWWSSPFFDDRCRLEAAELLAFEVLNPTLRSRGVPSEQVRELGEHKKPGAETPPC
jgi:hypothetical protein